MVHIKNLLIEIFPMIIGLIIMSLSLLFYRKGKNVIVSTILSSLTLVTTIIFYVVNYHSANNVNLLCFLILAFSFSVSFMRTHFSIENALNITLILSFVIGLIGSVLCVKHIIYDPTCDPIYYGNLFVSVIVGIIFFVIIFVVSLVVITLIYLTNIISEDEKRSMIFYNISICSFFLLSLAQIVLIFF